MEAIFTKDSNNKKGTQIKQTREFIQEIKEGINTAKKDAYNKFKLSEANVKPPYKALAAIF